MKNIFLFLSVIWMLSACVTQKRCSEKYPCVSSTTEYVHDTVVETIHDTTLVIKKDSSYIEAYLECDSSGRVLINQISQLDGKISRLKFQLKNNVIYVECKVDSLSVYLSWKNRYESKTQVKTNTITKTTNILTQWQIFQLWLGRILLVIILVYVAVKIIRRYVSV